MGIIGTILNAATQDEREGWVRGPHYMPNPAGSSTVSGEFITPENAMGVSAYYACLRNVAEDIGKLPVIVYKRDANGNKTRDAEHPLYHLLHVSPNPDMSAQTFFETLTHWAAGWGNGFAEIITNGRNAPMELWPIHPARVREVVRREGKLTYMVLPPEMTGEVQAVPGDRMFHLRGLGNGFFGYSVLKAAAETLGLSRAVEFFGAAYFGNGTTPAGVLTHPEKLGDEEFARLQASWDETHGGASASFKPVILEEGMTWTPIGVPPEQAQFLKTREFQVIEVCRWFRMPPHKIQSLAGATFSNIEQQALEYVVDTLYSWMRRIEAEIARKLIVPTWGNTYVAEFLAEALLRPDSAARSKFYGDMQRNGNMTINEVRARENLNGIGEAGDQHFVQLNMTTAEKALTAENTGESPESDPGGSGGDEPAGDDDAAEGEREGRIGASVGRAVRPKLEAAATKVRKAAERAARTHAADPAALAEWARQFAETKMGETADAVGEVGGAIGDIFGTEAGEAARVLAGTATAAAILDWSKDLSDAAAQGPDAVTLAIEGISAERAASLAESIGALIARELQL